MELQKLIEKQEFIQSKDYQGLLKRLEDLGLKYVSHKNFAVYTDGKAYYIIEEFPKDHEGTYKRRFLGKIKMPD